MQIQIIPSKAQLFALSRTAQHPAPFLCLCIWFIRPNQSPSWKGRPHSTNSSYPTGRPSQNLISLVAIKYLLSTQIIFSVISYKFSHVSNSSSSFLVFLPLSPGCIHDRSNPPWKGMGWKVFSHYLEGGKGCHGRE